MEQWVIKGNYPFKFGREVELCHLSKFAISQRPFFQYSSIPPFHLGHRPKFIPPVFKKVAIKKQSADVKAEPCLFFSVFNAEYVEGWRNRQGKQVLLNCK